MAIPTLQHTALVNQQVMLPYMRHIDDFKGIVNTFLYECTQIMRDHAINNIKIDEDVVKQSIGILEKKMEGVVDDIMNSYENFCMTKIFNIPENLDSRLFRLSSQLKFKNIDESKHAQAQQLANDLNMEINLNIKKIELLKELLKQIYLVSKKLDTVYTAVQNLMALRKFDNESNNQQDFTWLIDTLNNANNITLHLQKGIVDLISKATDPFFLEQVQKVSKV
ncbi:uncharacterized protein HGUI_00161 [Hanseniaspora guilliermondii]|uniref:Kinetochore-associated protein MTW1 n=1 Tax=Hanseniaspora guilliermondii TaxID=56406 RepID=A0A1L0CI41_9ASCO|nr:uncharacterized protein HGUI_00161 [Hanseniaspora guilliermondii]